MTDSHYLIMTLKEANKIFKYWQEYAEIHDKLFQIFWGDIPESFLPYPVDILEEALNVVAKNYFDLGDYKASKAVKNTIGWFLLYKKDEEAIDNIVNKLTLKDPKIKELLLRNLKRSRDSWAEFKNRIN